MSLDKIIDNRIGFGKAQLVPFFFLCFVDMNDGIELVLSSLITPILKKQWALSPDMVELLSSIFYVGTLFGSVISGQLSDLYGRKKLIHSGSIMQLIVGSMFLIVNSTGFMLLVRFMYGFAFGFTVSITTSMYAESAPSAYRGKGLLFLNFCISLGKLYGLMLAYFFLDSFTSGNWRLMMIMGALPNLVVLYGSVFAMDESPRFLISQGRYQESFQILNKMIKTNNTTSEELSNEEKRQIKSSSSQLFKPNQTPQISTLFTPKYRRITLSLCACWFSINFIYYGQLIILPFIYGSKEVKSFSSYFITVIGELPCFLLALFLVDKKDFGRRNSMLYFFFFAGLFHALFAFNMDEPFFSSIARFFMKGVFQMLYPLTTQSFNTQIRTLGFGFCAAVGRLGSIVMPYVIYPLLSVSCFAIFMIFVVFTGFGVLFSYLIPFKSLEQPLDEAHEQLERQLVNA